MGTVMLLLTALNCAVGIGCWGACYDELPITEFSPQPFGDSLHRARTVAHGVLCWTELWGKGHFLVPWVLGAHVLPTPQLGNTLTSLSNRWVGLRIHPQDTHCALPRIVVPL